VQDADSLKRFGQSERPVFAAVDRVHAAILLGAVNSSGQEEPESEGYLLYMLERFLPSTRVCEN